MPFLTNTIPANPDKILVIDDIPLISLAFQEIFRSINTKALVEYTDNIFTALSAKAFHGRGFDLIVIGALPDLSPDGLSEPVGWLKERFPKARIMVWSAAYDPAVIEKMGEWGVDAYVHQHEAPDEIRKAYLSLSAGGSYVSGIFRTLYSEYGLNRKNPGITGIGRSR